MLGKDFTLPVIILQDVLIRLSSVAQRLLRLHKHNW